jgi:hypothetical protein
MARKKPNTGKQKKEKLKADRLRHAMSQAIQDQDQSRRHSQPRGGSKESKTGGRAEKGGSASGFGRITTSFGGDTIDSGAKMASFFLREDAEEIRKRRSRGSEALAPLPCAEPKTRRNPLADPALSHFDPVLSHPIRPRWADGEGKAFV